MLEVKSIQDKSIQKRICEKCSVVYDLDLLAYSAYNVSDDGSRNLEGIVQFGIRDKSGYIFALSNADGIQNYDVLFLLGRTVLNFFDTCKISDVYCDAENIQNEQLIKKIGFKRNSEANWYIDLTNFFNHPCTE